MAVLQMNNAKTALVLREVGQESGIYTALGYEYSDVIPNPVPSWLNCALRVKGDMEVVGYLSITSGVKVGETLEVVGHATMRSITLAQDLTVTGDVKVYGTQTCWGPFYMQDTIGISRTSIIKVWPDGQGDAMYGLSYFDGPVTNITVHKGIVIAAS